MADEVRKSQLALSLGLFAAVGLLSIVPLAYMLVYSFDVADLGLSFKFGFDGWVDAFTNTRTLSSIGNTLLLSLRAPLALFVSVAVAFMIVRVRFPGRRFVEMFIWFGFLLPTVPMLMGWMLLLDGNSGLLNRWAMDLGVTDTPIFALKSYAGIIWIHITATTIPFLVILLSPAYRQFDASIEESGFVAGASSMTVLRRITLPLLATAFATAFIATLIKSLETFEVEQIIGTPVGINVYSNRIYDLMRFDPPRISEAMALSTVFMVVLIVLVALFRLNARFRSGLETLSGRNHAVQVKDTRGRRIGAAIIAYLFVGVTIAMPLTALTVGTFTRLFGFFHLEDPWTLNNWQMVLGDPRFIKSALSSITIGTGVAVCGLVLYISIAWSMVRINAGWQRIANVLVWLPWALPGLVLSNVLLVMFLNVPLLVGLYGSVIPMGLALIIKEMPIAVQIIRVALAQLNSHMTEAGFMSGASHAMVLRKIVLPLIRPSLIAAFLLVFAGAVRDISSIVLLAPPGTRTLSLLMFDFATSGELEAASVVGLIVAIICLVVTGLAFFATHKSRLEQ